MKIALAYLLVYFPGRAYGVDLAYLHLRCHARGFPIRLLYSLVSTLVQRTLSQGHEKWSLTSLLAVINTF